jgi:anaerobic ribonucleoside-triphosphate reductase activating protein
MRLATELNKNLIESIVDGEGFRLTIFTQGCTHYCKGCHNKVTWDVNGGIDYSVEDIAKHILTKYQKHRKRYAGLTISGGDPLYQRDELKKLLDILREEEPDMNIWVYTGYETDEVLNDFSEFISLVDVFVTGKFVEELKDYDVEFRGSTNQELLRTKDLETINV